MIGGDDSNTNAAVLAESFRAKGRPSPGLAGFCMFSWLGMHLSLKRLESTLMHLQLHELHPGMFRLNKHHAEDKTH